MLVKRPANPFAGAELHPVAVPYVAVVGVPEERQRLRRGQGADQAEAATKTRAWKA